jgi:hypothetical protein
MPNWKKVIVSGSDATLKSITIPGSVGSTTFNTNADTLVFSGSAYFTGSTVISGNLEATSITGSLLGTSSYALSSSYSNTASYVNPLNQTLELTGSLNVSGSTTQIGNNTLLGNTILSGSVIISGSANANANFTLQGHLRLDPGQDPGPNNYTASYLFTSASNTATGYDLYYRQDGNLIKFKWIEGGLSTGMLYGGGISYSGSTIFVKAGSGIINNMNASTGSEINPILTYVTWNDYTSSATYLTSSQNTYLYVDASGSIFQQTSFFNQTQYEQSLPLGRVTHPNFTSITGYGSNVQTTYDGDTQQNDFIRAFGPLKVSGFSITPQTGSLRLGIGSGTAFNLGGFYTQDPNSPSHYDSAGFATASIARAYRSGSDVYLDNNGGAFYTTVDSDYWDDGTGTLNTMNTGDWQIQRVFVNPVTGRVVVYYGQNVYSNLVNALQYLSTDSFIEGEFTAKSLIFAGYLVLKGQTNNLTDTANNRIINAGIFRNIAGGSSGGGAVAQTLNDLSDVIITTPSNYQALVYDGGNWINGTPLNATTASYILNAVSSSYALTASYALNIPVTASYALTASYVANTISSSYSAFALTASYALNTAAASGFPYTGSANITGSIDVVGSSTFGDISNYNSTHNFTGTVYITAGSSYANNYANNYFAGGTALSSDGDVEVTGSLLVQNFIVLSQVSSSLNYANDTTAAAGGVPLGGLYHTSGTIKIRLV